MKSTADTTRKTANEIPKMAPANTADEALTNESARHRTFHW